MVETVYSISHKPLQVILPDEPEPCSWDEFVRFGSGGEQNLSALYEGQLYPFICGHLTEGTLFTQIIRHDCSPSQLDVTWETLDGLYLTRYEACVHGHWYPACWASSSSCVIIDEENTWKYHTQNDERAYGPGASEVKREQVAALRKYTSKSILDDYYDFDEETQRPGRGWYPNPEVTKEMEEIVDKLVVEEIGEGGYLGYCHSFWRVKKRIFWEKYRIDWKSPAELYPTIIFD